MRIFILLGHPNKDTLAGKLAETYEIEAQKAGHEVKRLNIGDLHFDPILHMGYKVIQELEPDLKLVQEYMTWSEHFVLVYPIWWSAMPALLKGMWDRMFLPAFAFRMNKTNLGWQKLLKGRTARVITLSKTQPILIRILFGDFTNEIKRAILGFAGFSVKITSFGNTENISAAKAASLQKSVANLARKAK
jgi:putative NADPH-quinone reductase